MSITTELLIYGCAVVIGFIAAIPVGATQLEIARRALRGHLRAAMLVMAGSVTSDLTYGVIGFFGLAPFMQFPQVIGAFLAVGSVLSITLGIWIVRTSRRHTAEALQKADATRADGMSYATGFVLAFMNPLMIAWWLLGARVLAEVGVAPMTTTDEIVAFLAGGATGIASYHVTLARTVMRAKRFLKAETIRRTTVVFGVALAGIGVYLAVRFVLIVMAQR